MGAAEAGGAGDTCRCCGILCTEAWLTHTNGIFDNILYTG